MKILKFLPSLALVFFSSSIYAGGLCECRYVPCAPDSYAYVLCSWLSEKPTLAAFMSTDEECLTAKDLPWYNYNENQYLTDEMKRNLLDKKATVTCEMIRFL